MLENENVPAKSASLKPRASPPKARSLRRLPPVRAEQRRVLLEEPERRAEERVRGGRAQHTVPRGAGRMEK